MTEQETASFLDNAERAAWVAEEKRALTQERARRRAKRLVDAEEQPTRDPLRACTIEELLARPRPSYLVDQWIPTGSLCQVVGEPESLKSFFMCHVGLTIASGQKACFGYPVAKSGPVLYIAAEGGGAFQYRILGWCDEHGVDPTTVPFRVIPLPVNLRDMKLQQELLQIVHDQKPVLVIVDTLSRCLPGADENAARDMGEVVAFCTDLITRANATVAFVHHPTKSEPRGGGRGSGAIFGAVDTELRSALNGDREPNGSQAIQITCAKQKDDLKPEPLDLVGHVVPVRNLKGVEMIHASGRPITTLVLRPATEQDQAKLGANLAKEITAFLKATPKKTTTEIAAGISRGKSRVVQEVDKLLKAGTLEMKESRGRGGTKQVYAVAGGLDDVPAGF